MTVDRDERRRRALQEESNELERYAAAARDEHALSAALTDRHVDGLAQFLTPHVATALRGEVSATVVAKEWISEARTVATWLLRTGAVDAEAATKPSRTKSPSDSPWFKVIRLSKFFARVQSASPTPREEVPHPARLAEQDLVSSLEEKLNDSANYVVDDSEIAEHSAELARLLISNWFSVLEDAVQEKPNEALKLEYRAFPPSASPGVVTEGCEAFALPAEQAITKVFEYQQSLANPGESVELSPIVSLYRSKSGPWYAYSTKTPSVLDVLYAQEALETVESVHRRFQESLARATEAFSPLVIGRAMQFQARLHMDAALVHRCSYVAANAARKRLRAMPEIMHVDETHWVSGSKFLPKELSKHMAQAVLEDLNAVVTKTAYHWPWHVEEVNRATHLLLNHEVEDPLIGNVYMLALPAAAVLLSETDPHDAWPAAGDTVFDYPLGTGVDKEIFDATVDLISSTVIEASIPKAGKADLGQKIRDMMEPGHEPSASRLFVM